ncbi:MAG: S-adenosylmethionine synthetase N-terminal domain-containing protein [Nitrososphaeraceae archaeon]|nr:S-adenosylmethionine synthetase N-terminal domain-containing protein [Nitrososphaeraceae archaeon]
MGFDVSKMARRYLFTSESVTEGHPDKICDQVSDSILDEIISQDPDSRVAVEAMTTTGIVFVAGEVTSRAKFDAQDVVRRTVRNIGYDGLKHGLYNTSPTLNNLLLPIPTGARALNPNLSQNHGY